MHKLKQTLISVFSSKPTLKIVVLLYFIKSKCNLLYLEFYI